MSITTETQRDRFKIATGQQVSKGPTPNQIQENDYNIYFFEAGDERSEDPKEKYEPLKFHLYDDTALRADTTFPNLLSKSSENSITLKNVTPKLGSDIRGLQLSQLSKNAKDKLALLIAYKAVVSFREQNFSEKGPQHMAEFVGHFEKLHIHHSCRHPRGVPELHVTYGRPDERKYQRRFYGRTHSIFWHFDVAYELQPHSYTFVTVLEVPSGGGDALLADSLVGYKRQSITFQKFLSSLHVVQSEIEQANVSESQGGVERREAMAYVHPLVRYHPVLKRRSLSADPSFSRRIVELKKPKSDLLLSFLSDLIGNTQDIQLRAKWEQSGSKEPWLFEITEEFIILQWLIGGACE